MFDLLHCTISYWRPRRRTSAARGGDKIISILVWLLLVWLLLVLLLLLLLLVVVVVVVVLLLLKYGNIREQLEDNGFPRIPTGTMLCSWIILHSYRDTSGSLRNNVIYESCTPNLPTNIVPTNIAWVKLSGKIPRKSLGTWESHPFKLRLCSSRTPWNPRC